MKINYNISSFLVLLGLVFIGCEDPLDKTDLAAIAEIRFGTMKPWQKAF